MCIADTSIPNSALHINLTVTVSPSTVPHFRVWKKEKLMSVSNLLCSKQSFSFSHPETIFLLASIISKNVTITQSPSFLSRESQIVLAPLSPLFLITGLFWASISTLFSSPRKLRRTMLSSFGFGKSCFSSTHWAFTQNNIHKMKNGQLCGTVRKALCRGAIFLLE